VDERKCFLGREVGGDADDLDELVLEKLKENGEVRVAFLEGVGAKGLNDVDVVAGMQFWLRF
jgi:hypothetical protein